MNLSPLPIQKFFDNNSNPLNGGLLFTYVVGTSTKLATYTDSTGVTPNTNPIVLDFRGEANVWLDQTLTYKFVLSPAGDTDPPTKPIWSIDHITSALSYANLLSIITQAFIGLVFYPRTAAEIAAAVTPTLYYYVPGDIRRYGAVADDSTNCFTAISSAVLQSQQNGAPVYIAGGRTAGNGYRTTTEVSITAACKIYGDGKANSCIRTPNTNGAFIVAAGATQVEMSDFRISCATRHTTTPNTIKAIDIQGTAASRAYAHAYRDLYIDGYFTAIEADAAQDCIFDHVDMVFGKNFIIASSFTTGCFVYNCTAVGDNTGSAISIGDGVQASEGWQISNNLFFGFDFTIVCNGSQNHLIWSNQFDAFYTAAVYMVSGASMASANCLVEGNYMACNGAAGNSAVLCSNSIASSDPRGHRIIGNDIKYYPGATLGNGIRVDGTQETGHIILGNNVNTNGAGFDLRLQTGTSYTIIGNKFRGTGANIAAGIDPVYIGNAGTVSGTTPTVASAAALTLPFGPVTFNISGTTNITSVVATGHEGQTYTLVFAGALTFTDGSNLKLAGNFVTTADDTITIVCVGGNWFEKCRSIN